MIYCPNCGTSNRDGSNFCNECGTRLSPAAPPFSSTPGAGGKEGEAFTEGATAVEEPAGPPPAEWVAWALAGVPREAATPPSPSRETEEMEETAPDQGETSGPAGVPEEAPEPVITLASPAPPMVERPAWLPDLPPPGQVLQGVDESLPIAPVIAQPHSVSPASQPIPSPAQLQEAKLFEQILSEPAAPRAEPTTTVRRPWWLGLERQLVYLVILAAVLVPLLTPTDFSIRLLSTAPEVAAVHQAVAELSPGAPVLVAAEYEPAFSPELEPQAVALFDDLLGHDLRVLTVSTIPEGPALAQQALARARADYPRLTEGRQFASLGYLAGGESALRAFAGDPLAVTRSEYFTGQALSAVPAAGGIAEASDFGLIVVLSGRPEPVRAWIEQVGSQPGVRLAAGVSAAAEPQLRPYLASGQLVGLISGQIGAAQLEQLAGRPGRAVAGLDALSAGVIAMIVLVVLGSIAGAAGTRRGSR
jgi:hypothetical protein